jgi:hypothetical protein
MAPPLDPLEEKILDIASDNDGLWEFLFIDGERGREPSDPPSIERISANPDAFPLLHPRMVNLVRAGYITIRAGSAGSDDLSTEEAVTVLSDASNWVAPWEPGGGWLTKSDAYWVALTTRGEAARTS